MQYKNRIFKTELSGKQRESIAASMHRRITKHFLAIPLECPRSSIVFGARWRSNYKGQASEIYRKYVKNGSVYEINIECTTREDLAELMENTNHWKANKEYKDPRKLYLLFD